MDIARQVYQELKEGRWGADGKLPSFRSLAGSYGCSVTVIQQAVKLLEQDELVRAFHGKGVFWADSTLKPDFRRNRIIGVTYLGGCFHAELETLKEEWLRKGWFFASYNADIHLQDPACEKEFVLQARNEHFSSMVMLASPLEPVNRDLFAELRLEGMKIAHLVPYCADMSREVFFCADYIAAGRLAAAEAARRGYRKLIVAADGATPDRELCYRGVEEMAAALQLELLPRMNLTGRWSPMAVADFLEEGTGEAPGFLKELLALPEDCCICAQPPILVHQLVQLLHRAGKARPGAIALDDFPGGDLPVSRVSFDRVAQLRAALDYAADPSIGATKMVQRLFPASIVDRGTL